MDNNQRVTEAISAKLPKFWVGYLVASVFIIVSIIEVIIGPASVQQKATLVLQVVALGSSIYWFICIYKMHKVLRELTNSAYPITPAAAVGYHFIPFYNIFYWVFKWPAEIAKFVNARLGRRITSKDLGVFLFLVPFVERYIDKGIALMVMFGVGHYLSCKILQVIRESDRVAKQDVAEEGSNFREQTKAEKEDPTLADRLMGRVPKEENRKKRKK